MHGDWLTGQHVQGDLGVLEAVRVTVVGAGVCRLHVADENRADGAVQLVRGSYPHSGSWPVKLHQLPDTQTSSGSVRPPPRETASIAHICLLKFPKLPILSKTPVFHTITAHVFRCRSAIHVILCREKGNHCSEVTVFYPSLLQRAYTKLSTSIKMSVPFGMITMLDPSLSSSVFFNIEELKNNLLWI